MDLPKITIVVPSFNQGHFLGEALASIIDQSYPRLELIVMDGGSIDNSIEVIRRYEPFISYWQSQPDGGQSAAINAGMERATGDIVAWLNSDDMLHPGSLAIVGDAVRRHPGFGLYIGNGLRLDQASQTRRPFYPRNVALNRQALRDGVDYILQPSVFFSRDAWVEAGGLDPNLHFVMDWDILIRIAGRRRAVLIDEFLAIAREYEDTKTSSGGLKRAIEILQLCEKHSGRQMSVGAALFLLEALLREGVSDHLGIDFHRSLTLSRMAAVQALVPLTGNRDGFPATSDPGDVTYVPAGQERSASPTVPLTSGDRSLQLARSALTKLGALRTPGLLYRVIASPLALGVKLKLMTDEAALKRLRGYQARKLKLQMRLSGLSGATPISRPGLGASMPPADPKAVSEESRPTADSSPRGS